MGPQAQFVCQSSACRRQVKIAISTSSGRAPISNPRCSCGSEMKRIYVKPTFRKLSKADAITRLKDGVPV